MKWLRAHSKHIMVALVLLAMFSFVGAQGLQSWLEPDTSGQVLMRIFGRDVTSGELQTAQKETLLLERLFYSMPVWKFHEKLTVSHWFMLGEEADRYGIRVSDDRINTQIEQLPQLDELLRRENISMSAIRDAIGRQNAIIENVNRVRQAAAPSDAQVRQFVQDTQAKVSVKLISLDSASFMKGDEASSDAELQSQFERYRDADPDENEFGFGYKFDRRVRFQYVAATMSDVQKEMTISDEEIKEHWRANRAKYKKMVFVDPPTSETQPSTQPAEPAKKIAQQVEKKYSEAIEDVRGELQRIKAERVSRQAISRLAEELARPWQEIRTDKSGFKSIPDEVRSPDYLKSACDRISKKFGINLTYGQTPLMERNEIQGESALKGASVPSEAGQSLSLQEFAFRVPPFYEVGEENQNAMRLQLFQAPSEPLTVRSFQLVNGKPQQAVERYVLFRVIEAREPEAPSSLEDVREQVDRDIRMIRAYERMETIAREFLAVARRVGVEQALKSFDDLQKEHNIKNTLTAGPFARRNPLTGAALEQAFKDGEPPLAPPSVSGVGQLEEFVDACFEMTAEDWTPEEGDLPKTDRVESATTQPASDAPPKVRLVSIPRIKKRFIVELVKYEPVTKQAYETTLRQEAYQTLLVQRAAIIQRDWFEPENIEKRCGYVDVTPTAQGEDEESAQAQAGL